MTESPSNVAHAAEEFVRQGNTRLNIAMGVVAFAIVVLAVAVALALVQIQDSRYANCIAQNRRHDATIAYILKLAGEQSRHASKAKRAALAVAVTEDRVLIQDLAPYVNCSAKTQ